MRVWKQLLIGTVVVAAGVVLWGRFAPGADDILKAAGLPEGMVAMIAPAGGETEGDAQGRRGAFGGPTLVATTPVTERIASPSPIAFSRSLTSAIVTGVDATSV